MREKEQNAETQIGTQIDWEKMTFY